MASILRDQPEAVLRSHWARHWACAVDVLELLSTEAALLPSGDTGDAAGAETELTFGDVTEVLVVLISEQYASGGLYMPHAM